MNIIEASQAMYGGIKVRYRGVVGSIERLTPVHSGEAVIDIEALMRTPDGDFTVSIARLDHARV